MKITLAFTALVALASAANNYHKCLSKSKDAVTAINNFCKVKTDLTVPSYFAHIGVPGPDGYRARIQGNCNPPAWIPRKYCYSQMFATCAKGDKHGSGAKRYGKKGCQVFDIL